MRNWKILLMIASLSLSASLTSCGKKAKVESDAPASAPASAPAASAPAASAPTASKVVSKPVDTVKCAMKAADVSKVKVLKIHKSLNHVDRILKSLDCGNIAFNSPEEMNVGESKTIRLILSGNQSIQAIETALKKDLGKKDKIFSTPVRISEFMKADLSASESDFKIESWSEPQQAISTNESTEWSWKVTPKKAGKRDIHLKLSVIVKVFDQTSPRTVQIFDKYINVKVTTAQMLSMFISDNWQWLWTTILIPLAPFVWNGSQNRKEKMPSENSSSGDLLG
jgi:hypothetical protein